MGTTDSLSGSDLIRKHGVEFYVLPALHRGEKGFSINAGDVHRALGLENLVPSVCNALSSKKFQKENHVRLVSRTGPPSGKSTSVTYTYEFVDGEDSGPSHHGSGRNTPQSRQEAWNRLRGALKDVFAEYGGGEAYLRAERASFRDADERK